MAGFAYLSNVLLGIAYLSVGVAFLLLFWLYQRLTRPKRSTNTNPLANLTEMTILFQTMRSVLHEQKALAREFNESVDRKVEQIRQVVRQVSTEHGKIVTAQRELLQTLRQTHEDLSALRRQLGMGAKPVSRPVRAPEPVSHAPKVPAAKVSAPAASVSPLLNAVAQPDDGGSKDLIDNWVGLDIGGQETSFPDEERAVAAPELPRDPETARQAFRALLNMGGDPGHVERVPQNARSGGNGRDRNDSLRNRVYGYHDAGMSVSEIARELGMGKGEVRLIIGLREKKTT
jgi:hypothetical protein